MSIATDDATAPRSGSSADLSRRMDRLETKHDELATDVAGMKQTVSRVEINQQHEAELSKMRFDALTPKLDILVNRIEPIFTGELPASKAYAEWKLSVEDRLNDPEKTPAGRALADRIDRSDQRLERMAAETARNRQWIAVAAAIVSFVVLITTVIGPTVLRLVFP